METKSKLLSWKNRKANLENIERYHKFKVMFYRTNNLVHTRRVLGLLKELLPFVKDVLEIDVKLAELIAIHHDDYEIILGGGDIPLQTKLMMNNEELSILEQEELFVIETLSDFYPKKIKGYNYEMVLKHAVYKNVVEAQLVSFCDKVDGLSEALHEVLAGNLVFLEPVINYYNRTFNVLRQKYPLIKDIFDIKDVWFDFSYVVDLKEFFNEGLLSAQPHSRKNINRKVDIPYYKKWKSITKKRLGIDLLIKQIEFHIK